MSFISAFAAGKKPINKYDDTITIAGEGERTFSEILSGTNVRTLLRISLLQHENAVRLFSNPDNDGYKTAFIDNFPKSFVQYKQVFQPDDFGQLYPSYFIYSHMLSILCKELPKKCGPLIIGLGKEARYEANATGDLQKILDDFVHEQTDIFLNQFEKLSEKEREHLAFFMTDYETIETDPDFSKILKEFKNRKKAKIYEYFLAAKEKRMREGH